MKTKVLILEDNAVVQKFYEKAVANLDFVELVGIASNGEEGLKLLHSKDPDVILCDLNMPIMDGFEFTRRAMMEKPKPILIVSDLVQDEDISNRFKVLELGAIDVLPKPKAGGSIDWLAGDLERKINILKGVIVFSRKSGNGKNSHSQEQASDSNSLRSNQRDRVQLVAIGASTGGPQAFQKIFSEMDPNFSIPIVCVQHISEGFTNSLVSWLSSSSKLKIKLAQEGDILQSGLIYFPPDGLHISIENHRIHLDPEKGSHRHKPSVNYLFDSVAKQFGARAAGVLLTGMGEDGAEGLLKMRQTGAYTIAQDEFTSIVYGMPRVAKEKGAALEILPIEKIAQRLGILGETQR